MNNYFGPIFSTPFLHLQITNWHEKKSKLKEILSRQKTKEIPQENIITDFHYSKDYTEELSQIFSYEMREIHRKFGLKDYFIRNAWFEIAKNKMDHKVHNHGAVGLSAVCYIDYDPIYHTPTHFISSLDNTDIETGTTQFFIPQNISEKSLIVFPSRLNHFTLPNTSDIDRTILAFNINKKPEYIYSN